MKPLHSEFKRLTRCPCCMGKYSKYKSGSKAKGSRAARRKQRIKLKEGLYD